MLVASSVVKLLGTWRFWRDVARGAGSPLADSGELQRLDRRHQAKTDAVFLCGAA
jgi:hypothetical protein